MKRIKNRGNSSNRRVRRQTEKRDGEGRSLQGKQEEKKVERMEGRRWQRKIKGKGRKRMMIFFIYCMYTESTLIICPL